MESAMNKVRLTPEAVRDLAEIKRYISKEFGNPIAAQRIAGNITGTLRILERHSMAGPSVEALTGHISDLRLLNCGQYIVIYRVEEEIVSIARIIHRRQDYMRVLFGDME